MDLDETMVEGMGSTEAVDTPEEDGIVEEEQDESEDLSSFTGEGEDAAQDEPEEAPKATEPGYIRGRIDKAVAKAVAQTRAEMQAMFDQQMAPIREKMLNDEAKELVRQGEFKSLDRAKEYLQLKQGIPAAPKPETAPQPRNERGQYVPKEDPVTSARIDMLAHQADTIKAKTGIDVIDAFNTDGEIKQKIIDGEIDFYDVAEMLKGSKRTPPSPMRSPNGASGQSPNAIESMSKEQFARLEKRISEGARIRLS